MSSRYKLSEFGINFYGYDTGLFGTYFVETEKINSSILEIIPVICLYKNKTYVIYSYTDGIELNIHYK